MYSNKKSLGNVQPTQNRMQQRWSLSIAMVYYRECVQVDLKQDATTWRPLSVAVVYFTTESCIQVDMIVS